MPSTEETVLATIDAFLASFSDVQPPFTATYKFVKPDSYVVLSHPSGIIQSSLEELVASWEDDLTKVYASGATSASESVIAPGPEVRVAPSGTFASVWAGFGFKINGDEKIKGVYALSFEKTDDDKWLLTGLADKMWRTSDATPETVATSADLTEPVEALLSGKTDESLFLPGSGATISGTRTSWAALSTALKTTTSSPSDWATRTVADVGFVWTGSVVVTLLNKDGKWLISSVQA
ncbi:hypothetical protein Sste5346_002017 [Sporothrix stenoceras]|uniref:SnoaL-like domain-containing protein n=1 Tax=Sporothrix stenoceras TaxID=5173 RepID=A0ABR3ZLL0_9PEZI